MTAYYNENNRHAAAWLRDLILRGMIADGIVDTRSIADVAASDLVGYDQVHLFAGIGGWSLALRQAGLPDDFPVWTGSCPCQPFSNAGLGRGTSDSRHLWPDMLRLIAFHEPAIVFGEQVESKAGRTWLRCVRSDVESLGYGAAASDLPAASVGADHARQRLYWFAHRPRVGRDVPSLTRSECHQIITDVTSSDESRSAGRCCFAEARSRWLHQPELARLADGVPRELDPIIRSYGNAIVPPLASEFIIASLEAIADTQ